MKAINDAIMALVPRSSSSSGGGSTTVYVPVRDGNTGDGTSVVTPGTGTSTLTPYVRSDTTLPFTVRQGQAYCFKMTLVNGSNILPLFTVGNGSVFKTQYVAQIGNGLLLPHLGNRQMSASPPAFTRRFRDRPHSSIA